MISNFSRLTAFNVADPVRPWGRIRDFLLEFPACRARYFSVDAHVGVGMKEIWAPLESLARVDPQHMAVTVLAEIDKEMVRHLSRLEAPQKDQDELRLHRLYHTAPAWAGRRRAQGGNLRKRSRLLRGSQLIGFDALSKNGSRGKVSDLLFEEMDFSLQKLRLEYDSDGRNLFLDFDMGGFCQLLPEARAVYLSLD